VLLKSSRTAPPRLPPWWDERHATPNVGTYGHGQLHVLAWYASSNVPATPHLASSETGPFPFFAVTKRPDWWDALLPKQSFSSRETKRTDTSTAISSIFHPFACAWFTANIAGPPPLVSCHVCHRILTYPPGAALLVCPQCNAINNVRGKSFLNLTLASGTPLETPKTQRFSIVSNV
jgi:LSD1 subclass zinc finger protein